MFRIFLAIIPILISYGSVACTSAPFRAEKKPTAEQALLYIYRPSKPYALLNSPKFLINGQKIASVSSGRYKPVILKPGPNEIKADGLTIQKKIVLQAKPGETYFLRLELLGGGYAVPSGSNVAGYVAGSVLSEFIAGLMSKQIIARPGDIIDSKASATNQDAELFFVKRGFALKEIKERATNKIE